MKKINKIISITLIVFVLMIAFSTLVLGAVDIDKISDKASVGGGSEISKIGSYIYSGVTSVGIVLAVVIVAILGVKYMMGSADERAEYKKSMMPYLIGAFLVFGASTIAKAVVNLAK